MLDSSWSTSSVILSQICTSGYYCPGGHTDASTRRYSGGDIEPCPPNSESISGNDSGSMYLCNSCYTALAYTEPPCEPLCTACEAGTYKAVASNIVECEQCPADTYIVSLHDCWACPDSNVLAPGSTAETSCIPLCLPGYTTFRCTEKLCRNCVMTTCAGVAAVVNFLCLCSTGSHCPGGHLSFTDEHCIACPHNHWCVDNFAWQCGSNELASPNSSRHGQCRCAAGFYHEHGACVECLMHNICSNESRRAVGEFDPGLRTVLLDDNVCAPGMFRTSRMCKTCPRHFLLP